MPGLQCISYSLVTLTSASLGEQAVHQEKQGEVLPKVSPTELESRNYISGRLVANAQFRDSCEMLFPCNA